MHHPVSTLAARRRRVIQSPEARNVELLESRIAPAFTGVVSGNSGTLTDDAGASTSLTIFASGGVLHHDQPFMANTAGAFNSDVDFDSSQGGDQTISTATAYALTIDAGDGDDRITLGGTTAATSASAFVTNGTFFVHGDSGGSDSLILEDSADPSLRGITVEPAFLQLNAATFNYDTVEAVTVKAGLNWDTFFVFGGTASSGGVTYTLNGGGGTDEVYLSATTAANIFLRDASLALDFGGGITSTFNLSSMETAYLKGGTGPNTFNVSDWTGRATLEGGLGHQKVVNVTFNGTAGLVQVTPFDVDVINVYGTDGADSIGIDSRYITRGAESVDYGGSYPGRAIKVDAGGGDDVFNVTGTSLSTSYTLIGGSHVQGDVIAVTSGSSITLSDTSLQTFYTGFNRVTLAGLEIAQLKGGQSADTFTVSGWTGSGSIDGLDGNDTVIATNDVSAMGLSDAFLTRTNHGDFTLSGIENAKLTGGAGDTVFNVGGFTGDATITGGSGKSTLDVSSVEAMTLTVLSESSGTISYRTITGIDQSSGTFIYDPSSITANGIGTLLLHSSALALIGDTKTIASWSPSGSNAGGGFIRLTENSTLQNVFYDGPLKSATKLDVLSLTTPAGSDYLAVGADANGYGKIGSDFAAPAGTSISTIFSEVTALVLDLGANDASNSQATNSLRVNSLAGITGLSTLRISMGDATDDTITLGGSLTTLALPSPGGIFAIDGRGGTDALIIQADVALGLVHPGGIPTLTYDNASSLTYSGLEQFNVTVNTLTLIGGGGETVGWTPDRDVLQDVALASNAGSLFIASNGLPSRTIVYHLDTIAAGGPPPLEILNVYQLDLTTPAGADVFGLGPGRATRVVRLSGTTGATGDRHDATIANIPYINLDFGTGDATPIADQLTVASLASSGLLELTVSTGDGDDTLELASGLTSPAVGPYSSGGFVFDAGAGSDTIKATSPLVYLGPGTLKYGLPSGPSAPLQYGHVEHFIIDAGVDGRVSYHGSGSEDLVWTPDAALTRQGTVTFGSKDLTYRGILEVSSMKSFTLVTPAGADDFTLEEVQAGGPLATVSGTLAGTVAGGVSHRADFTDGAKVVLDFASGDGNTAIDDRLTVSALAAVDTLSVKTGAGDDTLSLNLGWESLGNSSWDAGPGHDVLKATSNNWLDLADGSLSVFSFANGEQPNGQLTFTDAAVEEAKLEKSGLGPGRFRFFGWSGTATATGGAFKDTFDFSGGFSGTGSFSGGDDDDTFILQNDAATSTSRAFTGGLSGISLDGGDGVDTLHVHGNLDFTLTDSSLVRAIPESKTAAAESIVTSLAAIEHAVIGGGASGNLLNAAQFSGLADLSGEGGIDNLIASKGGGALYGFHAQAGSVEVKSALYTRDNYFASPGRTYNEIHATSKPGNILSFRYSTAAVSYTIPHGFSSEALVGDGLYVSVGEGTITAVEGSGFGDHLTGNKATNFLIGGKGNDVLRAVGFDYLYGGPGADKFLGATPFRFQDSNYPIPNSAGVTAARALAPAEAAVDSLAALIARVR